MLLSLATQLPNNGYSSNFQWVSSLSLNQAVRWQFTLRWFNFLLARRLTLVPNSNSKFRAPENETEIVPPHYIVNFLASLLCCVERVLTLSWMVATYGSHWNSRQTPRLSLSPPLSSQALSSPLSTSSDCSNCHTTANELSTLRTQAVWVLVAICSASWYLTAISEFIGDVSDLY